MGFIKVGNTYINMRSVAKLDFKTISPEDGVILLFVEIRLINGSQEVLYLGRYTDTTEEEILAEAERSLSVAIEGREVEI